METVLVLGGDGMLGHQLLRIVGRRHPTTFTVTGDEPRLAAARIPAGARGVCGFDATDGESLVRLLGSTKPEIVINAVGLVKQKQGAGDWGRAVSLNATLPRRLALLAAKFGYRLIHFSTDCVFSGSRGAYRETDVPDAGDVYGISKLVGEQDGAGCVTLRTSIVGPELGRAQGLFEWFRAQGGAVKGYANAFFSGLTTTEAARVVCDFVLPQPALQGLYHLAGPRISKYELLQVFREATGRTIDIERDEAVRIDRSLDGSRFAEMTSYRPKDWKTMIGEMMADER